MYNRIDIKDLKVSLKELVFTTIKGLGVSSLLLSSSLSIADELFNAEQKPENMISKYDLSSTEFESFKKENKKLIKQDNKKNKLNDIYVGRKLLEIYTPKEALVIKQAGEKILRSKGFEEKDFSLYSSYMAVINVTKEKSEIKGNRDAFLYNSDSDIDNIYAMAKEIKVCSDFKYKDIKCEMNDNVFKLASKKEKKRKKSNSYNNRAM